MSEDFFDLDKPIDEITMSQLDALGVRIFSRKKNIADLEEEVAKLKAGLVEMQSKMISTLERFGRSNYTVPGEGMLIKSQRSTVTLPKTPEDKSAFYQYLKDRGIFEQLISVNSNTLNSFYNREADIAAEEGRSIGFSIPGIAPATTIVTLKTRK